MRCLMVHTPPAMLQISTIKATLLLLPAHTWPALLPNHRLQVVGGPHDADLSRSGTVTHLPTPGCPPPAPLPAHQVRSRSTTHSWPLQTTRPRTYQPCEWHPSLR